MQFVNIVVSTWIFNILSMCR